MVEWGLGGLWELGVRPAHAGGEEEGEEPLLRVRSLDFFWRTVEWLCV